MRENDIRVFAVKNKSKSGINIYLDFSGQREYVMTRRSNYILYNVLKDGRNLAELRRMRSVVRLSGSERTKSIRTTSARAERSLRFLLKCIDEYLFDRDAYYDYEMGMTA